MVGKDAAVAAVAAVVAVAVGTVVGMAVEHRHRSCRLRSGGSTERVAAPRGGSMVVDAEGSRTAD